MVPGGCTAMVPLPNRPLKRRPTTEPRLFLDLDVVAVAAVAVPSPFVTSRDNRADHCAKISGSSEDKVYTRDGVVTKRQHFPLVSSR